MDELLPDIHNDEQTYIGRIFNQPFISTIIMSSYSLHLRPTDIPQKSVQNGSASVILASGETIPVIVIGRALIEPTPELVQSGDWDPFDEYIYIRDTDLTHEQAQDARFFVQRQASDT